MEYALPTGLRDETGAAYAGFALAVAAERGEPWLSFFTPGQLSGLLQASGMTLAEQVRQRDAVPVALWDRSDALRRSTCAGSPAPPSRRNRRPAPVGQPWRGRRKQNSLPSGSRMTCQRPPS